MPLPPPRSCSPSSPKATSTATPSSSGWPGCRAGTCSGPTACSIQCCTGSSARVLSRRSGPRPRTAAGASPADHREGRAQLAAQRQQWQAVDDALRGIWMKGAAGSDGLRQSTTRGANRAVAGVLRRRRAVHGPDVEELEGHLRDQLTALTESGLTGDEAFLVAASTWAASMRCLASSHARIPSVYGSSWSWRQTRMSRPKRSRTETLVVLGLAVAAASLAVKLPALFGVPLNPDEYVPAFLLPERKPLRFSTADDLLPVEASVRRCSRPPARAAVRRRGLSSPTCIPSTIQSGSITPWRAAIRNC